MSRVHDFFEELDRLWGPTPQGKLTLKIIGASALLLRHGYDRGTKDSDVYDVLENTSKRLLELAGPGTDLHTKHKIYIQIVHSGTPFIPQKALYHPIQDLNDKLTNFEITVLDVVDVVVSKLGRFWANDQRDIRAMVETGLVPHERLIARFREAISYHEGDTNIELPSWII